MPGILYVAKLINQIEKNVMKQGKNRRNGKKKGETDI